MSKSNRAPSTPAYEPAHDATNPANVTWTNEPLSLPADTVMIEPMSNGTVCLRLGVTLGGVAVTTGQFIVPVGDSASFGAALMAYKRRRK